MFLGIGDLGDSKTQIFKLNKHKKEHNHLYIIKYY